MYEENIRMLLDSLGGQVLESRQDSTATVAVLMTETIRFRDKLKSETGETLTVEDTQIAIDALEHYLINDILPDELTAEQRALAQIYVDRLTVFSR